MRKMISQRVEYLQKLVLQKKKALEHAPDGLLKGNRHYGGWQYYHRKDGKDKNGTYIKASNFSFAQALGQKAYDEKILESAEKELKLLSKLQTLYESSSVERIYSTLPKSHQQIIYSIQASTQKYLETWLATPYNPQPFHEFTTEYYSEKGERMRSKSEVLIANLLAQYEIPYLYEKPLHLKGYGIVHPDFTLLDVKHYQEIYWEHMGLLDDREYREHALSKILSYEQNDIFLGEGLMLTFETSKQSLNMRLVEKKIAHLAEKLGGKEQEIK